MATTTQSKDQRLLVIDGNLVRVQRTIVEREVKTSDFVEEIARLQPLDTGLLPKGCFLMSRRTDKENRQISVYAIERAAGLQCVKFKPDKEAEEILDLELSWPATAWFARCTCSAGTPAIIRDLWVACIKHPVANDGLHAPLFQLPMPNIHDSGSGEICLGNLTVGESCPAASRVDDLIDKVLSSLWNTDLAPDFKGVGIEGLVDWAEKTKSDPQCSQKLEYKSHRCQTIEGLMAQLLEALE